MTTLHTHNLRAKRKLRPRPRRLKIRLVITGMDEMGAAFRRVSEVMLKTAVRVQDMSSALKPGATFEESLLAQAREHADDTYEEFVEHLTCGN